MVETTEIEEREVLDSKERLVFSRGRRGGKRTEERGHGSQERNEKRSDPGILLYRER